MVRVDRAQCRAVADVLRGAPIPEDREDTTLPTFDRRRLPNLLFLVVALCHQTTPATGEPPLEGHVDGRLLRGWDYLFQRFAFIASRDKGWTDPREWASCSAAALRTVLRDEIFGDRLTDAEGRAALTRDLGQVMERRGWTTIDELHEFCGGRLAGATPNIVEELRTFRAYTDPVRKKSYYFLALMRNMGLWTFVDPEHLGPPADYHEVRGHLRIGTVVVENAELSDRLARNALVSVADDNAIRAAVVEAIETIAADLEITPSRAHYMFWNVFRNICTRERPQCFRLAEHNPLPERYDPLTRLAASGRACPFSRVCRSARASAPVLDPKVITEYH